MLRSSGRLVLPAVGILLLAGCAGTYDSRYAFEPRPADFSHLDDADGYVRSVVSVVGVRRADEEQAASVEVRLRVENDTERWVSLRPDTMVLHTADVQTFRTPIITPAGDTSIDPHGEQTFVALFPFPAGTGPGDFDLDGLSLRWAVEIDGRTYTESASFQRQRFVRRSPAYPRWSVFYGDRYYDDWGWGFGYHSYYCR